MRTVSRTIRLVAVLNLIAACRNLPAQNAGASPKGEVVLTNLASPGYPQLAKLARTSGDVQVEIEVRRNGSVATASVIQGRPLLAPAALESAKYSLCFYPK